MNRRTFLTAAAALPLAGRALRALAAAGGSLEVERLGASTACLAGLTLPEALGTLARLGFSTVEIIAYTGARHSVGPIPGFDYRAASPEEREAVYRATRGFRHLSAHMPFDGLQLFSSDAERRRSSLEQLKGAMDGLAYLEGSLAVVHAGWPERGSTYREIWPRMVETLRMLGDYAGERGLTIGLETMQPDSVPEYIGLLADVDHPRVGATIDTGHIRGAREIGLPEERRDSAEGRTRFNDVLDELVEALGEKTVHVHLSDVRSADWRDHQAIGTGIVDFARFFDTLRAQRYDGLLVFELEEPETVRALGASKAYVEQLIGTD